MNRWHSIRFPIAGATLFFCVCFVAALNAISQTHFSYQIPAAGPIIYDGYNQRMLRGMGWIMTNEAGNEVFFCPKGTNETRTIGCVYASFYLWSNQQISQATARLRLYAGAASANSASPPGALLYDSGPVKGMFPGYATLVADGLQFTDVPDSLFWTLTFDQLQPSERIGFIPYWQSRVGFCFNDYWENQTNGWTQFLGDYPGIWETSIFGARFMALATSATVTNYIMRDLPTFTPTADLAVWDVYKYPRTSAADTNRFTAMARFQLTANSANEGVVSISPYPCEFYPIGTPLTLTASPAPGCYFSHWSDGSTNPVYTLTLDADSQLSATFGVSPPSVIHFQRASKSLTLQWDSSSVLQQATNPAGPWVGAAYYGNPVTIPISGKQQYFRLRSGFGYE